MILDESSLLFFFFVFFYSLLLLRNTNPFINIMPWVLFNTQHTATQPESVTREMAAAWAKPWSSYRTKETLLRFGFGTVWAFRVKDETPVLLRMSLVSPQIPTCRFLTTNISPESDESVWIWSPDAQYRSKSSFFVYIYIYRGKE